MMMCSGGLVVAVLVVLPLLVIAYAAWRGLQKLDRIIQLLGDREPPRG
jgi:hypothetical protein